jgi:hypothetical protein
MDEGHQASLNVRGHGGVFKNDTSSLLYWFAGLLTHFSVEIGQKG